MQHPTCGVATKGIRVCYNVEKGMQHKKPSRKKLVANTQETLQHPTCGFATKGIPVCYNLETRMQH